MPRVATTSLFRSRIDESKSENPIGEQFGYGAMTDSGPMAVQRTELLIPIGPVSEKRRGVYPGNLPTCRRVANHFARSWWCIVVAQGVILSCRIEEKAVRPQTPRCLRNLDKAS